MTSAAALSLVLASVTTVVTGPALAHISLDAPKGRYWQTTAMQTDQNKQKTSPCGSGADSRTKDAALITTYKPGEKITLKFTETIQHPGHFEVSFDTDGQDFPFPGEAPSATSGVTVLVSNVADKTSADYSVEVTLPNLECEKCTLQLVQVMTTKMPPYGTGDLYFQCADIILKGGGGGGTGGASAGGASAGGASATGGGTAGGMGGVSSGTGGVTSAGMNSGGAATGGGFGTTGGSLGATGGSSTTSGGAATGGAATGGTSSSTGGTFVSTGGTTSSTGGAPSSGGTPSSTGGTSSANAGSPGTAPGSGEEPGCSMTRSPRSGAVFSLFALSALLGWQRRRAVSARRRRR